MLMSRPARRITGDVLRLLTTVPDAADTALPIVPIIAAPDVSTNATEANPVPNMKRAIGCQPTRSTPTGEGTRVSEGARSRACARSVCVASQTHLYLRTRSDTCLSASVLQPPHRPHAHSNPDGEGITRHHTKKHMCPFHDCNVIMSKHRTGYNVDKDGTGRGRERPSCGVRGRGESA
jgi:hypothetical protein